MRVEFDLRIFDFVSDFASIANRATSLFIVAHDPIGVGAGRGLHESVVGGIYAVLPHPVPPELPPVVVIVSVYATKVDPAHV